VTQLIASNGNNPAGRIVTGGGLRGKTRTLASAVTASDIARLRTVDSGRSEALGGLRDALKTFSEALYGRTPTLDATSLDAALSGAMEAARGVKAEHSLLKTILRPFARGTRPVESRV
jgi:hypothetical protein